MFDKVLVVEILQQIFEATVKVMKRFELILHPDDFIASAEGMEKLDSICMQIIAIGESLKKVDKITNYELLPRYPVIDWKGVKGMRDIISHHYFDIDAEEIFYTCKHQIWPLSETIKKMIEDLGCSNVT